MTTTTEAPATVNPWAFLDDAGVVQPTTYIKAPPVEADIPAPIRAMCERALVAHTPMRVKFPDESMAKDARKLMLGYALVRTITATVPAHKTPTADKAEATVTGPVTIRATIQNDKLTLHFTVKEPFTPTPAPAIPTPAVAAPVKK